MGTNTEQRFIVRRSRIHGGGLFAARALAVGEVVAEYSGERITKAESIRRQARRRRVFIFELDASHDLDGGGANNPARFANHGCEPNCEAVADGQRIFLRALRAVDANEELTFDYGYRLAVFPGYPCRCGAPSCAGFIVERTERWRMQRLLGRTGRSLLAGRKVKLREVGA